MITDNSQGGAGHIMRRRWGLELISSEKRHLEKVGAETEGKIKSGVEAGELGPPPSGCYYTSIMRNREAVVVVGARGHVFAPWHTLD